MGNSQRLKTTDLINFDKDFTTKPYLIRVLLNIANLHSIKQIIFIGVFYWFVVVQVYAGEILREGFEAGVFPKDWKKSGQKIDIVDVKDDSKVLRVNAPGLVVVSMTEIGDEYTVQFKSSIFWSADSRFVFLYQNPDNYYSFGLSSRGRGVVRIKDGNKTVLDEDELNKLTVPHERWATGIYKVCVRHENDRIVILIDKAGDGVDYDIMITETDPKLLDSFSEDRFGFICDKGKITLDDVVVTLGKVVDQRSKAIYHVDVSKGDDTRTAEEAGNPETPWKTIQMAATIAKEGDTVLVAPGTYHEMVIPANNGSFDEPIVFKALDPNHKPVISGCEFVNADNWEDVDLTDFRGQNHKVHRSTIDWIPPMLYQAGKRMMVAQEPNQINAKDPYELELFYEVPDQISRDTLKDSNFFTQSESDYWKGAKLLLWDSHTNIIGEYPILSSDDEFKGIIVMPFRHDKIGNRFNERRDKYALRDHKGILDQPGEYWVNRSIKPYQIYVMPYNGMDIKEIKGSARDHGFAFIEGREHIVVDGFIIRGCSSSGIAFLGREANHITIRNCNVESNMGSGISGRFVDNITIEKCLLRDNYSNGIGFTNCRDMKILNCEITANGDNGIWFGSGQSAYWNSDTILIRGCYIHHARARRRHPDNFQMHQVRNVTLENNIFLQEGNQNMWCQYSDNFVLRNNLFIGGTLGINSSMHSYIYHNVFWESNVRYNRHLDNHPQNKDYYKPQVADIRNNVFVNSFIAWPPGELVDRFKVFTVDHNFYSVENAHALLGWDWNGNKLSLEDDTIVIADVEVPAQDTIIEMEVNVTWSNPAKLVFLYQDPENYYWVGIGKTAGVFRRMNGKETRLFKDEKGILRMPHMRNPFARYTIGLSRTANALDFSFIREIDKKISKVRVLDRNETAIKAFTAGKFGLASPSGRDHWCSLSNAKVIIGDKIYKDGFEDRDYKKASFANELTWIVEQGEALIKPLSGSGVGFGEGSIVLHDTTELTKIFKALPDEYGENSDFHPVPGSPIIDAGVDVGIRETLDEKVRPFGEAPDIGPYENR